MFLSSILHAACAHDLWCRTWEIPVFGCHSDFSLPTDLIYLYICICRKLIEYFIFFLILWEMGLFNLVAGEMAAPSESLSSLMYKLQCDLMKVIFFFLLCSTYHSCSALRPTQSENHNLLHAVPFRAAVTTLKLQYVPSPKLPLTSLHPCSLRAEDFVFIIVIYHAWDIKKTHFSCFHLKIEISKPISGQKGHVFKSHTVIRLLCSNHSCIYIASTKLLIRYNWLCFTDTAKPLNVQQILLHFRLVAWKQIFPRLECYIANCLQKK